MNLLVINLDKAIFSENSASLARLKEYSRLVDKMFVLVWTKNKFAPIDFENRLFIYPTNSFSRLCYLFDTWRLARKILKLNKIDLIFTQDPFETGLAGVLIAKFYKIRLQLQIHTDVFSPYFRAQSLANSLRAALAAILIGRADGLRVVSSRIKQSLLKRGVLEKKIFVLPIFTDVEKFIKAPVKYDLKKKYPRFEKIILMASRLSPEKNISIALEAVAEVIKNQPRLGLVIVGAGTEKENIFRKIKRLGLENNVIVEPWAHDLADYYKGADLYLLTSNYEGWGMAVVEALAAGCPVVMTDVGCAGELVIDGQTGLVAPVGDAEALSRASLRLMADEPLRLKIIEQARQAVKNLPSKSDYLDKYKKSWGLKIIL